MGLDARTQTKITSVTAAPNKIIEKTQLFPLLSLSSLGTVKHQHKSSDTDEMRADPWKKEKKMTWTPFLKGNKHMRRLVMKTLSFHGYGWNLDSLKKLSMVLVLQSSWIISRKAAATITSHLLSQEETKNPLINIAKCPDLHSFVER